MNRKAVSSLGVVIAILLIIFLALGCYYLYTQLTAPPTPVEVFAGTLSVTMAEDNFLDRGASVSTTSDNYVAYHTFGKTIDEVVSTDFLGGSAFTVGTAKDISVDPIDNGHFFLLCYTGTDFYLEVPGTLGANPRINAYKLVDADNDNRLEVVFDVDVSSMSPDPKPSLDIIAMVVSEDTDPALNSPANQSTIGTGTKTGTIEWQITGVDEKKGKALARLYVSQNRSQEDYMKVTAFDIDGVGTFNGGKITYDTGAKTWYVDIDISDYRELVYAKLLERPSGSKSYFGVTVSWETYFVTAGDGVEVTLYVETIGADEAVDTALSDAVTLSG